MSLFVLATYATLIAASCGAAFLKQRTAFLTLFLLLGFLGIAIVVVYITGWSHLVERLANVYPQGRLVEILNLIYLRLAMGFLLLLPVALGLTLFYTHNVAGPLVRIKRYLRLMARGEFDLAPLPAPLR